MTLCDRCVHWNVCGNETCYDDDAKNALTRCADFFDVVRCKDCIFFKDDTEYCQKRKAGYCEYDDAIKDKNHFCGYGERKGEGE